MVEGIERADKTSPDRGCACGRELLRADDGAQARESRGPPPQRRSSSNGDELCQPRIGFCQDGKRGGEIGVVAKKARGNRCHLSLPALTKGLTRQSIICRSRFEKKMVPGQARL